MSSLRPRGPWGHRQGLLGFLAWWCWYWASQTVDASVTPPPLAPLKIHSYLCLGSSSYQNMVNVPA